MDVDSYIATHGAEWRRLEQACARGASGLARLSGPEIREVVRLYLRASSHLAEATTRYAHPGLTAYLNHVVSRAHGALYSGRSTSARSVIRLFGARYREAVRRTAPFVACAAVLLIAVILAAGLWVALSPEARAGVLPAYAREAIREATGRRADIGVAAGALSTFILLNNVQVAFLAFAAGITLGAGTIYILVTNAVLVGALAGGFAAAGKAGTFWFLVLPHGLLELTAVCIAAGAGLRMGWAIVDPGDRPRGRALAEESRDAVLVVVGVIPAFGAAALIEGFLTGSASPVEVQLAVGSAAAALYAAFLFGPHPRDVRARLAKRRRYRRPNALIRRY